MNTHIKTQEFKDKGYLKVWCSEGHYITDWNKENIMDFRFAKTMYCPLGYDLTAYYCITDEECENYEKQMIEAYEKERENNR